MKKIYKWILLLIIGIIFLVILSIYVHKITIGMTKKWLKDADISITVTGRNYFMPPGLECLSIAKENADGSFDVLVTGPMMVPNMDLYYPKFNAIRHLITHGITVNIKILKSKDINEKPINFTLSRPKEYYYLARLSNRADLIIFFEYIGYQGKLDPPFVLDAKKCQKISTQDDLREISFFNQLNFLW